MTTLTDGSSDNHNPDDKADGKKFPIEAEENGEGCGSTTTFKPIKPTPVQIGGYLEDLL